MRHLKRAAALAGRPGPRARRRRRGVRPGAATVALGAIGLVGTLLAGCGSGVPGEAALAQAAPGDTHHTIAVAGEGVRSYDLHLPTPRPAGPLPLVLAFHGALSTPLVMAGETHLDRIADAHGFVVAYPAGYEGTWNEGAGHTPAERAGIDDVTFVATLLSSLRRATPSTRRAWPRRGSPTAPC